MLVWRYYKFSCASCEKTYLRSLSPFQLGTGKRRCPACAEVFADGSREWPELSGLQKFEYVWPTAVLGYFGAMIVAIVFAIYVASDLREMNLMLGVLTVCMILPWAPYFLKRRDAIRSSNERFTRRQALGPAGGEILSE
jgi:hypothetical protein